MNFNDQSSGVGIEQDQRTQVMSLCAGAAAVSGMAWILKFVLNLAGIDEPGQTITVVAMTLGLVSSLGGLAGLHIRGRGKLSLLGFLVASVGTFLLLAEQVNLLLGFFGLYNLALLIIGYMILVCGFVLLGVATIRAKVLPVWSGSLLIVGSGLLVLSFFYYLTFFNVWGREAIAVAVISTLSEGAKAGSIVLGLLWLALAYALWSPQYRRRIGGG